MGHAFKILSILQRQESELETNYDKYAKKVMEGNFWDYYSIESLNKYLSWLKETHYAGDKPRLKAKDVVAMITQLLKYAGHDPAAITHQENTTDETEP